MTKIHERLSLALARNRQQQLLLDEKRKNMLREKKSYESDARLAISALFQRLETDKSATHDGRSITLRFLFCRYSDYGPLTPVDSVAKIAVPEILVEVRRLFTESKLTFKIERDNEMKFNVYYILTIADELKCKSQPTEIKMLFLKVEEKMVERRSAEKLVEKIMDQIATNCCVDEGEFFHGVVPFEVNVSLIKLAEKMCLEDNVSLSINENQWKVKRISFS